MHRTVQLFPLDDIQQQRMSRMTDVQRKTALVTGAARGLGRAVAIELASRGMDIIGADICEQLPNVHYPMATTDDLAYTSELVEKHGVKFCKIVCDTRDYQLLTSEIATSVRQMGRLDCIVANAGISPVSAQNTDPEGAFDTAIAVNLKGTFNTIHASVPHIIGGNRGGSIALVSSTQGISGRGGMGHGGMDGYVASKHGVVGLMRTWANWLAPHNIRVNTVHPTGTQTPMVMNEAMAEMAASHSSMESALRNLLPVPMIQPEDVAAAVGWLCSDDSRYVTGTTLPVDAGFLVK